MSTVRQGNFGGIDRSKAPEPELGTEPISGERYYSKAFMEREWAHMWTRVWQIAGRVDELKHPGDFITAELGPESIICVRGDDGEIRGFYNVCQHRGNQLVHTERGTIGEEGCFECAYHGWRFSNEGTLRWVYCEEDFAESPIGRRNLNEIACESWAGFIWFNMDPQAQPLREWLGPVAEHLDTYRMENMKRTHWVTLEGEFNWKCVQDNFNESYHLPYVHPQTIVALEQHYSNCQFDLYDNGHARMLMPGGGPSSRVDVDDDRVFEALGQELAFWEIDPEAYRGQAHKLRGALQARKRELAGQKGYDFARYSDEQLTDNYHYTLFPNISFSMKPDGCIWLRGRPHPTDPEKCYFDMWYLTLFPEGAKEYYSASMAEWVSVDHLVEHQAGKAGEVSCGPGIDQDVTVWATQQKGLRSRGFKGKYLPSQERRIRYFHETLDGYVNGEG